MLSEFRKNLVSGEWILFATGRAKRPQEAERRDHPIQPKKTCPMEDLEKTEHTLRWRFPDNDQWVVTVVENKFPAVRSGQCGPEEAFGPFRVHQAIGVHDLFVFRYHDKQLHTYTPSEMIPVVQAYKRRKKELIAMDQCLQYVSLFHNFGADAGASIQHPHSQILAMPILPPSVNRSIHGADRFYQEHDQRVYDVLIAWEQEHATRVIYENDHFIAICPYASKRPGEMVIYPKNSIPHFSEMSDTLDVPFAEIVSVILRKMAKALHEPSYNFFIHTSPVHQPDIHKYYTWHMEIVPKLKIDAGFELGTGIDINMVDPDEMAQLLRDTRV